jgi:hypothetical protein
MTVTIGRRELLAALGGAAAWPMVARRAAAAICDRNHFRRRHQLRRPPLAKVPPRS